MNDKISPKYYQTKIQPIDFIQANNLNFCQGNVIKYVVRYREKNGKEDLLKARQYIDFLIKDYEDIEKTNMSKEKKIWLDFPHKGIIDTGNKIPFRSYPAYETTKDYNKMSKEKNFSYIQYFCIYY